MKIILEESSYEKYKRDFDAKLFSEIESINPNIKEKGITEWLFKQYIKNKDFFIANKGKIKESLIIFNNLKKIKRIQENDINKYDLEKLFSVAQNKIISSKKEKKQSLEGAKKIYEDENWLLLIPETYESSCLYGSNTKWCVSSKNDRKKYDEYMAEGYLMFLLNKKTNEKYSMNKERNSFVNAVDNELNNEKIYNLLQRLPKQLSDKIEKEGVNFVYRNLKNKIIKGVKFTKEDIESIKTISDVSKNKLLRILMAQVEDDIFHDMFKKILQKTLSIKDNVFVTASLVDDTFYLKELKKLSN